MDKKKKMKLMPENIDRGTVLLLEVFMMLTVALTGYVVFDSMYPDKEFIYVESGLKSSSASEETDCEVKAQSDVMTGKYEYNSDDIVVNLELNNDGTATYFSKVKVDAADTYSTENGSGKIMFRDEIMYLLNDECKMDYDGSSCNYPNCNHILEFKIGNGSLTHKVGGDSNKTVELKKIN